MPPTIETRVEGRRGCGYRKPGGLYLVSDGLGDPCGKLPIALSVCPTCGCGIKPCRGWTWVDGDALARASECRSAPCRPFCPLAGRGTIGRAGLLWIGEVFYPTPEDFLREARARGVSRRIAKIPRGFRLGRDWVLLAHRRAVPAVDVATPGIFHAFIPSRLEYVVVGNENPEDIEHLISRGITPVRVVRDRDHVPLFDQNG